MKNSPFQLLFRQLWMLLANLASPVSSKRFAPNPISFDEYRSRREIFDGVESRFQPKLFGSSEKFGWAKTRRAKRVKPIIRGRKNGESAVMSNRGPKKCSRGPERLVIHQTPVVSFNIPALMMLVRLKRGKKEALRNVIVRDGTDVAPTCQRSCEKSRPSLHSTLEYLFVISF